jgi:hypothetical protein
LFFIPVEEKQKLMNRAYFDDDEETWRLRPLANKKYVICVLGRGKNHKCATCQLRGTTLES